jgi:hypothetical protein
VGGAVNGLEVSGELSSDTSYEIKKQMTQDLIGQRFGCLEVTDYAGRLGWKCKCDCGKFQIIAEAKLKRGKQMCGRCLMREAHRRRRVAPLVDKLRQALHESGSLSRTQIRNVFQRSQTHSTISTVLAVLQEQGIARREMRPAGPFGGKPAEVWVAL